MMKLLKKYTMLVAENSKEIAELMSITEGITERIQKEIAGLILTKENGQKNFK